MKQGEVKKGMKVRINEKAHNEDYGIVEPVGKTGTVRTVSPCVIEVRLDPTPEVSAWRLLFKPQMLELLK